MKTVSLKRIGTLLVILIPLSIAAFTATNWEDSKFTWNLPKIAKEAATLYFENESYPEKPLHSFNFTFEDGSKWIVVSGDTNGLMTLKSRLVLFAQKEKGNGYLLSESFEYSRMSKLHQSFSILMIKEKEERIERMKVTYGIDDSEKYIAIATSSDSTALESALKAIGFKEWNI